MTLERVDTSRGTRTDKRRLSRKAAIVVIGLGLCLIGLLADWGAQAIYANKLREAYLPELEAMARQSPTDPRVAALLGARLEEAGEYSAAIDQFHRAAALGADNPNVWLNLSAAQASMGNTRAAAADLNLASKAFPDSKDIRDAADRVRSLGNHAPPDVVARAINVDGPVPLVKALTAGSVLNGIVRWWGRRHGETSGFTTRQDWVREQPNDANVERLWGVALMRNRRYAEAKDALTEAVAIAPKSPAANLALADVQEKLGMHSTAVNQYVTCLQLRRDWLPALVGLGQASLAINATRYSIPAFQRATTIQPNSADAWIGLGRSTAVLPMRYAESLRAFQRAAPLAPGRTDFYTDYAVQLRESALKDVGQSSRLKEAQDILRQRIAAEPNDALAHYLLGNVILYGPQTPQSSIDAESETRKALELKPNEPYAEAQLGKILLARGDAAKAVPLLSDAVDNNPSSIQNIALLAKAYGQLGDKVKSAEASARMARVSADTDRISTLQTAEKSNLLDVNIHQQLAELYARSGQLDSARNEQRMVDLLRRDPKAAASQLNALSDRIGSVITLQGSH